MKLELLMMTTYPNDRERESFHMRTEGTKIGTKQGGEHVDALVNEVHGRPTSSGFVIHGRVRVHKMRHVGNIWPSASATPRQTSL